MRIHARSVSSAIGRLNLVALALLASLTVAMPASAQSFPKLTGRVVDGAHLLTAAQMADVDSKLSALEVRTGRQLVVATVPSLEGHTIEDYGYRLGRTWAIGADGKGEANKDDGTILIVAPKERKVRIETVYGARVFLTDAVSSVIINDEIIPRFKANNYGGGIVAGTDAIIQQLELPAAEAAKRANQANNQVNKTKRSGGGFPFMLVFFIFFFVVLPLLKSAGGRRYKGRERGGGISPMVVLWGLDAISRGSRGGGGWGGGGGFGSGGGFGGGGGFSGGGGSFGGGGASGGW